MPSINDIYTGDYLKAADILGKRVPVRISTYSVKEFEQNGKTDRKLVLGFDGKSKQLVVNKTNAAIITSNLGTDDYTKWPGKSIVLVTRKVESRGQIVDAIRVSLEEGPTEPIQEQPAPQRLDPRLHAPATDDGDDEVPF